MNIRNIKNTDYITKEIMTFGPDSKPVLALKHKMTLYKLFKNLNTGLFERTAFYYEYSTPNMQSPNKEYKLNLFFRKINDYLVLESKINLDQTSKYGGFIKCKLYYKDFVDILKSLNEVETWFIDLRNIYMFDENGLMIDVKEEKTNLVSITFFKGTQNGLFLSFNPSILFDSDVVYPAVEIRCLQGVICKITLDEFLTLKLCLTEYINNFNQLSNDLLHLCYLHNIGYPENTPIYPLSNNQKNNL